jgi:hypothetical protein
MTSKDEGLIVGCILRGNPEHAGVTPRLVPRNQREAAGACLDVSSIFNTIAFDRSWQLRRIIPANAGKHSHAACYHFAKRLKP